MITIKKIILILLIVTCVFLASNVYGTDEITILIDPGHGGFDGGAVGLDGTLEKDIALDISYALAVMFENIDINVIMTRYSDIALGNTKKEDIYKRCEMINQKDVDLFISIHLNYFPNEKLYGAQAFYYNDNEELALCIQSSLCQMTNTRRGAKTINNIYILEHVNTKGCLVELGFLSNEKELALLKDNSYQNILAYSIYLGVLDYLARC